MYKNHCYHPDILLLNCPQNAGNSVSERGMPPTLLEVSTPSLKKSWIRPWQCGSATITDISPLVHVRETRLALPTISFDSEFIKA